MKGIPSKPPVKRTTLQGQIVGAIALSRANDKLLIDLAMKSLRITLVELSDILGTTYNHLSRCRAETGDNTRNLSRPTKLAIALMLITARPELIRQRLTG